MGKRERSAPAVASAPVRRVRQGPVMPVGGGDVLTVARSSLHVLGPGRSFDLNTRQPMPFAEAEAARAADS